MGHENRQDKNKSVKSTIRNQTVNKSGFVSFNCTNVNTDTTVSCCYTNPDMLANKMGELESYIKEYKPLIIGIAEVKPKHSRYVPNESTYSIDGYSTFHKNINNRIGRGVILYVHKSLLAEEVIVQSDFEEFVCVEIKLQKNDKLLACVIYRSDSGTELNNSNLNKLMTQIADMKYSHKLIMGDFNYRSIDWNSWTTTSSDSSSDSKFIESARDGFYYQHILEPTRGRIGQKPSCIDLVFTNENKMINTVQYLSPLGKSDHCVIQFDFSCYTNQESNTKVRYIYDKGDYPTIKEYLSRDWEHEFSEVKHDPEQQWDILLNHLEFAKKNIHTYAVRTSQMAL